MLNTKNCIYSKSDYWFLVTFSYIMSNSYANFSLELFRNTKKYTVPFNFGSFFNFVSLYSSRENETNMSGETI